ncbi:MAG TPA: tetratricopeptide repeat protein [Phycisphaerae bacterium]|nr:tetratricopeptide repeat protein [Phycisphaerae bacterium]
MFRSPKRLAVFFIAAVIGAGARIAIADDGSSSSVDYAQLGQAALNGDTNAVAKLTTDANAGILDAEYQLGFYYYQNLNYFQAAPWLEKAGEQEVKQGNIKTAIDYYDIASFSYAQNQQNNKAAEMYMKLGDLNYDQTANVPDYLHYFQAAISAWQNAVKIEPTLLDAQIRLMNSYNEQAGSDPSNWPQVFNLANTVLQLDPKNASAYRVRAEAVIGYMTGPAGGNTSEFAQVISDLDQAVELDPSNAENSLSLAKAYLLESQFELLIKSIDADQAIQMQDNALQIMQDFAQKNPNDVEGWLGLASICNQISGVESNAVDALNKAIALEPKNPDVISAELQQLIKYKVSPDQVGKVIEQLIAAQPNHMNNYMVAGEYYAGVGDYATAAKYLNAALDHPTPGPGAAPFQNDTTRQSAHELLADLYMNLVDQTPEGSTARNDYIRKASDAISWVQSQQLDTPWVYVNQGRLYAEQQQYDSALDQLKGAESLLSPTNQSQVHMWLLDKQLEYQIYTDMGQNDAAGKVLEDIDHYFPNQPIVLITQAKIELEQNPAAALTAADTVLVQDATNQEALDIKAEALALLGKTTELKKVLDSIDNLTLPLALLKTRLELIDGDYQTAWQTIKPWVQQYPTDPQVITPAYAALAGINDRTDATELIFQVLKAHPDNEQYIMLNIELARPGNPLPLLTFESLTSNVVHISQKGEDSDQTELAAIHEVADPARKSLLLTDYYLDRGQNDQASQALQDAENTAAQNADVIEAEFRIDLAEKDYNAAAAVATKAGELNIDRLNGDLYQARLDLAENKVSAALDLLQEDLQTQPNDAELEAYDGEALLASGDTTSGVTALQNALKQKPDELAALRALIDHDIQTNTPDSLQQSRDLIDQGLSYYPLDPQMQSWSDDIADLVGDPGPQITKRLAEFQVNPDNIHNVERLALLYTRNSQPAESISILNTAFQSHPDNIDLAQQLVSEYMKQNNLVAAQGVYEQLSESSNAQSAFMGRILLGDLYQTMGSVEQAAQMYIQAQQAMPDQKVLVQNRLGDMFFDHGDFADALKCYGQLYAWDSKDHRTAMRYAETLIKAGQTDAGLKIIDENLLANNVNDEEALVLKGEALLMQQQFSAALIALNQALSIHSQDIQALYERARVYLGMVPPKHREAIDDLLLAESIDSKDFSTRLLLAQTYVDNEQYPEAVHEYQQTIALSPDDQTVRLQFAELLFNLADQLAALSPNDNSDAAASLRIIDPVTQFQNLVADSLNHKLTNLQYAQWLALDGQYDMKTGNTQQGVELTKKAYEASGKTPPAALAYLRVLMTSGQYEEALETADQAIADSPKNPEFYVFRGRAYSMLGNFPQSHADFVQALTLSMGDQTEYFQMLSLYQAASDDPEWLDGVIEHLSSMQNEYPDQAALLDTSVAIAAFLKKDNQNALQQATAALAHGADGVCEINALRIAAMTANNLDKNDAAKNYYQKLIALAPDDSDACNNLAYLLAQKFKDPQDALHYAQQANTLAAEAEGVSGYCHVPNNLDTLGWIYYLNDDYPDAYDALEASMQYNPPPEAYYHLGEVLIAQNNFSEAKQALQKGLEAAQQANDPVADQIQSLLNSDALQ